MMMFVKYKNQPAINLDKIVKIDVFIDDPSYANFWINFYSNHEVVDQWRFNDMKERDQVLKVLHDRFVVDITDDIENS